MISIFRPGSDFLWDNLRSGEGKLPLPQQVDQHGLKTDSMKKDEFTPFDKIDHFDVECRQNEPSTHWDPQ